MGREQILLLVAGKGNSYTAVTLVVVVSYVWLVDILDPANRCNIANTGEGRDSWQKDLNKDLWGIQDTSAQSLSITQYLHGQENKCSVLRLIILSTEVEEVTGFVRVSGVSGALKESGYFLMCEGGAS